MRPTRIRTASAAALAPLVALTLSACGSSTPAHGSAAVVSVPGSAVTTAADGAVRLPAPFAKPHLVLTDDHDRPFDLVRQTAGRPTLLYFGYTHCPDICPTTMADIAVALTQVPTSVRDKVTVVFVTTDPTRDTPAQLHSWLASFNPAFVGLSGDFTTTQKAARALGISIDKPVKQPDGSYLVTHGAEVLAFSAGDDRAHELFPAGTSVRQFTQGITALVKGGTS